MMLRMLSLLEARYLQYNGSSNQRIADVALRDMAALVVAYWGMRRGAELWMNRDWSMGLRRCHVTFVTDSHVTLFLQSMKNDPLGKGTEVVLAWVTGSGVRIGQILLLLQARLEECGIPSWGPLFCSTSSFNKGGYLMPKPGSEATFQHRLRVLLKRTYRELAEDKEFLDRFGHHSLRRGGAENGFQKGIGKRLLMGHGGWTTEQGMQPYMAASLQQKLTIVWVM